MKLRVVLKSKIHRATITEANVNYVGSISIDESLMKLTGLITGEKVAVWNVTNGERIETYAVALPAGSGQVIINGAAAHLFAPGDLVIIAAFYLTDEAVVPQMILVDDKNRFVKNL